MFKITKEMIDSVVEVRDRTDEKITILKPATKIKDDTVKKLSSKNLRDIPTKEQVVAQVRELEAQPKEFVRPNPIEERVAETENFVLAGKRYFSISSESFVDPNSERRSAVKDQLRENLKKYWTPDVSNKSVVFGGISQDIKKAHLSLNIQEPYDDEGVSDFGRVVHWIAVENRDKSNNTKATVKENEFFFDHTYSLAIPFTDDEVEELQVPHNSLFTKIDNHYNFYLEEYEKTITRKKEVLDNTLPNIYVFMSELTNDNPNVEFKNFISLDGTLVTDEILLRNRTKRNKFDIKKHPIGQYYDLYAKQYEKAIRSGATRRLASRFSNICVPISEINKFKEFSDMREMFPMFNDISFGTDRTTTFAEILKDAKLTNSFIAQVVNRHVKDEAESISSEVSVETIIQREGGNRRKVSKRETSNSRAWDMALLMENLREGSETLNRESIFLGNQAEDDSVSKSDGAKFFKSLMFNILQNKFQILIKQKFRTYEQVMNGKEAYSETVLYRISKQENSSSGKVIQDFWLPNSNEIDVLRYVDTQVKYNKRYVYKVWAYQMVIGTKYWYSNVDTQSTERNTLAQTFVEPSILLVETPYIEITSRITDKPPIPPDLNIVPYKGVDNQMLFNIKGGTGEFDAEPITIEPSDQSVFNVARENQKKDLGEKITFKSDDHPSLFQLFRIEHKPRMYSDFTGKIQASIKTDQHLRFLNNTTSVSFVDRLEPNKKYYYIARTIDVHNNISNPTPVYEVEIINENGLIFPIIKVVDFEKTVGVSSKPARRFIQIVPSILQSLINEEKSGYETAKTAEEVRNKIHLGVASESIWGKKFKIRLTSKSTGKKLEMNVRFEHKDDKSSRDNA